MILSAFPRVFNTGIDTFGFEITVREALGWNGCDTFQPNGFLNRLLKRIKLEIINEVVTNTFYKQVCVSVCVCLKVRYDHCLLAFVRQTWKSNQNSHISRNEEFIVKVEIFLLWI